jgi:hypothetical protein
LAGVTIATEPLGILGSDPPSAVEVENVHVAVKSEPGAALPGLVLQVSCLVELLVVIDAEREPAAIRYGRTGAANLGLEEACSHTGKDHLRRKAMQIRHGYAAGISGNLSVVPFNRERDRCIAQHAEIVAIVRVL